MDYYETEEPLSYAEGSKASDQWEGFQRLGEDDAWNPYKATWQEQAEAQYRLKLLKSKKRAINFLDSETYNPKTPNIKQTLRANPGPNLLGRLDNFQARFIDENLITEDLFRESNPNYGVKFKPQFPREEDDEEKEPNEDKYPMRIVSKPAHERKKKELKKLNQVYEPKFKEKTVSRQIESYPVKKETRFTRENAIGRVPKVYFGPNQIIEEEETPSFNARASLGKNTGLSSAIRRKENPREMERNSESAGRIQKKLGEVPGAGFVNARKIKKKVEMEKEDQIEREAETLNRGKLGTGPKIRNAGLARRSKAIEEAHESPFQPWSENKGRNIGREQYEEPVDEELFECRHGCGRKFNENALGKHEKICKRVFMQKRRKFDSKGQREVAEEQKELQKASKAIQESIDNKKKMEKPKWKRQSEAFQAQIKNARGGNLSIQEKKSIQEAYEDSTLVRCPTCDRKFSDSAASRHIPFCANKAKFVQFKTGAKKKP